MIKYIWRKSGHHYDLVTDAWRHILGDHFHFGYFDLPETSLENATISLADKLAGLVEMDESTEVLDVGCGIGAPAFYLHEKYGSSITGISTSTRGIELAARNAEERGVSHKVRFSLASGLNNGFPANRFDVIWLMESSHTMRHKKKLFTECFRVLKPGGVLAMCDIMFKKRPGLKGHLSYAVRFGLGYPLRVLKLQRFGGPGKMATFDYYVRTLHKTGFSNMETTDISDQTFPTLAHWRANIARNRDAIRATFSEKQIDEVLSSCNFLEDLYKQGFLGYGMLRAVRQQ